MPAVNGYSADEIERAHEHLTRAIVDRDQRIASYRIVQWGPSDGYEAVIVGIPEHAGALQQVLSEQFSPDRPDIYRVEVNADLLPREYEVGDRNFGIFTHAMSPNTLPAAVVDEMTRSGEEFQRARTSGAPIHIIGWDEEHQYWAAVREGESSFLGVQDIGDAINASSTRGNVPVIVSDEVYEQMVQRRDAWLPRPARVESPPS